MTQCKIDNNDIHIIFIESDEIPNIIRLDNGTEIEFINDDISAIVLPNLMQQLPYGMSIDEISLESIQEIENDIILVVLNIKSGGQISNINVRIDISSLNQKVYIWLMTYIHMTMEVNLAWLM